MEIKNNKNISFTSIIRTRIKVDNKEVFNKEIIEDAFEYITKVLSSSRDKYPKFESIKQFMSKACPDYEWRANYGLEKDYSNSYYGHLFTGLQSTELIRRLSISKKNKYYFKDVISFIYNCIHNDKIKLRQSNGGEVILSFNFKGLDKNGKLKKEIVDLNYNTTK